MRNPTSISPYVPFIGISRVCAHIVQGLNLSRAHCYNTQCTAAVAAMPSSCCCC